MIITSSIIEQFRKYLIESEKSDNTISKYIHDVCVLKEFMSGGELSKERLVSYKEWLRGKYKLTSANSMIAAANSLLDFMGLQHFKVRQYKIQRPVFIPEAREIRREDYRLLVNTAHAKGKIRIALIMETIASTGIRVSELRFLTYESLSVGEFVVHLKAKERRVMIPKVTMIKLRRYCRDAGIKSGVIFTDSRNSVWKMMKNVAKTCGIRAGKVFPHNLRHLFAKSFYEIEGDIAKLADILGHNNINTTRVYLITSGREHRKILDRVGGWLNTGGIDTG